MLGRKDLVLCAGTLASAAFEERVAAAAEAGFAGVSLFASDYDQAREDHLSDADMRAILSDYGIEIAELDPLMRWIPGAELAADATGEGAAFFRYGESDFYRIADALGARSINLVAYTDAQIELAKIAEAFAGVCDRAAQHGLLVHLEFLPWTQIPDLATANTIVDLAGRPNGGIMLDCWHHFRGGGSADTLRSVPGERILGIQLNDAPSEPAENLVEETMRKRKLPGEGAIELASWLRTLDEMKVPAPIGVEVFSDELIGLAPREVAARAAQATRRVLEAANSKR